MTTAMRRRSLRHEGLTGTALSVAALRVPGLAWRAGEGLDTDGEGAPAARNYEPQAAFHQATTTQDLELMMSLRAEDATFNAAGTIAKGADHIRSFGKRNGSLPITAFRSFPCATTRSGSAATADIATSNATSPGVSSVTEIRSGRRP